MNIDEKHIIDYVEGNLTESEASAVALAISEQPELHELYTIHKMIFEARDYEASNALKSNMAKWQEGLDRQTEEKEDKRGGTQRWTKYLLYLLLGLMALYGIYQYAQTDPAYDQLISSYYEAPIPAYILDHQVDGLPAQYSRGIALYANGDYQAAEQAFAAIQQGHPIYENARVLQLHSLFMQTKYKEAQLLASDIMSESQNPLAIEQSDWMIALMNLASEKKSLALQQLTKIVDNESHLHQKEAQRLLKDLR